MRRFITRVELHGASGEDYQILHAAMEKENFSRKILGNNGFWYQLSTAEYYKICNDTLQQVLDSAKRAATTTTKLYSIISSESSQSQWIGFSTV